MTLCVRVAIISTYHPVEGVPSSMFGIRAFHGVKLRLSKHMVFLIKAN